MIAEAAAPQRTLFRPELAAQIRRLEIRARKLAAIAPRSEERDSYSPTFESTSPATT